MMHSGSGGQAVKKGGSVGVGGFKRMKKEKEEEEERKKKKKKKK